jgi:hypothetical protein
MLLLSLLPPTKVFRLVLLSVVLASITVSSYSCSQEEPGNQSFNGVRCLDIQDEAQHFHESSSFQMPRDAQIVLSCDDHSGFHWEGEYYIVFDTTARDIATYLESSPWQVQWQRGKIPDDIISRIALSRWKESNFDSSGLWYLLESRGTQAYDSNGRLMVINPEMNRVFYTEWNY